MNTKRTKSQEELEHVLREELGSKMLGKIRTKVAQLLVSPEYKRAHETRKELRKQEETMLEEADWFGMTGLPEDVERELPRYLRREFGESIIEDDDALKARELEYLGTFVDDDSTVVHYWRIGAKTDAPYAYVRVYLNETNMGWCGSDPSYKPPRGRNR